ncbi:YpjP family protein [Bacillaceae bacterium Marseille-Q3522]|nr:YpjP family protein [Bacillaceae bacterium Marseille-Q3522]
MRKWLRKAFVILVTVLTFGMVVPSQSPLYDHGNNLKSTKRNTLESSALPLQNETFSIEEIEQSEREKFMKRMTASAEEQAFVKFGERIKPVIEDEFRDMILPNIVKAIDEVAVQFPDEELTKITITESPGGGTSEKIFHLIKEDTKEDIIRFHVRRDRPPQSGYWFHFHYHTYHDQFQAHYALGEIYWSNNTPPKWMS